jgi:hypothetical protein
MATQGWLRMAARSSLFVLQWFKLACCIYGSEDIWPVVTAKQ